MTEEEKQSVVRDVLNKIKASSLSVDELKTVNTLDGVNSLPAQRGNELVRAPISLLTKQATDAAGIAERAVKEATDAVAIAKSTTNKADTAAIAAREAVTDANKAVKAANDATVKMSMYESRVNVAMDGASARFAGFVEGVKIEPLSFNEVEGVYYDLKNKRFCAKSGNRYCNNWVVNGNVYSADIFLDGSRTVVRRDKVFICGASLYVWCDANDNLVEVSGNGARIWTFEGLSNINNVNQSSDLWKPLCVNSLSELVKLMDNHVFVDRISTADGKYSYFPCLLTYDGSNMVNIAIDSLRTRKIIGMYFLSDTVIRINSVYTLNLEYPNPVNVLTSTSTTVPLSANMGRQLSSQISSLAGTVNTINAWKNKMPEVGCVPIRNLARGQATPEESKVKEGWLAVYWIMANFSTGGEVSSPIIGSSSNALNNIEVPVMMGTGTKLKVTVGAMNDYAKGFTVKNEQGVDVTNSYRLWGIVFGTK